MDPNKIRPLDGWALILADNRREASSGGIILPAHETGIEKVTEGAGVLLKLGAGKLSKGMGLEPNVRVVYRAFLKYANPVETDEKWEDGSPKEYFLLSLKDILGVIPPGVDVGVFSGRPMVKEL